MFPFFHWSFIFLFKNFCLFWWIKNSVAYWFSSDFSIFEKQPVWSINIYCYWHYYVYKLLGNVMNVNINSFYIIMSTGSAFDSDSNKRWNHLQELLYLIKLQFHLILILDIICHKILSWKMNHKEQSMPFGIPKVFYFNSRPFLHFHFLWRLQFYFKNDILQLNAQ